MARWKFVHKEGGIVILVEADSWQKALAKIGRGKVIHSNLDSTKLPPGWWEVSEEPIVPPEVVAALKAHFSAPTSEFWEWVKEFTGKPEEAPE